VQFKFVACVLLFYSWQNGNS